MAFIEMNFASGSGEDMRKMEVGSEESRSVGAGVGTDYTITYQNTYSNIPVVLATAIATDNGGYPIVRVKNKSLTGCTIRVSNSGSGTNTYALDWLVIEP